MPRQSRLLWHGAGATFFSLGAAGIFVPLLPTTVFWILAAVCWGKSDPSRVEKLRQHAVFGAGLAAYLDHRIISRRGKVLAVLGMSLGGGLSLWLTAPPFWVAALVGSTLTLVAIWLCRHPERLG